MSVDRVTELADEGRSYPRPTPERPHAFVESDFHRFCDFCGRKRSFSTHDKAEIARFKAKWARG